MPNKQELIRRLDRDSYFIEHTTLEAILGKQLTLKEVVDVAEKTACELDEYEVSEMKKTKQGLEGLQNDPEGIAFIGEIRKKSRKNMLIGALLQSYPHDLKVLENQKKYAPIRYVTKYS